jgi:hypothetical protein
MVAADETSITLIERDLGINLFPYHSPQTGKQGDITQ